MDISDAESELINEITEKFKQKLESGICQELCSTWVELWDEDERMKRRRILAEECVHEMQDFLEDVLVKEKKTKDDYIERIEKLLSEINDLQTNLEIAIPYEDVESLPLHNMAFHLNKKAEKYRLIKNDRINRFSELIKQEAELCEHLGMIPIKINFSPVPTMTELKQLENHITAMEQEKVDRSLIFKEQCQKVKSLFKELDIKPSLKFEKDIVEYETLDSFCMSNENMKSLADLLKRLEDRVEEAKSSAQEISDKLNIIWNYLDVPEHYRKNFMEVHSGHSVQIINSLKEELSRCEAKKRENISKIVTKIRKMLVEEWDKCLLSKDERDNFRPFHIDCFTEDLCVLHELEIERLRNYYHNNEQIFNLITKHEKLFNKLIELEERSKNTNRYYNRGGQLLQEERERKTITKELPVVEDELRTLLKKYEENHGKPFTSFGVPMLLILDEQWNAHFDQKTIDKLARKKGSEKKQKTPLGGKRPMVTPGSSVASKLSRLNNDKAVVSSTTKSQTRSEPRRAINLRARRCISDDKPDSTFRIDSTYDEFQNELQAKVEGSKGGKGPARSTAVEEGLVTPMRPILREKNTPIVLRSATATVKTTPAKLSSTPMYSPSIRKTPRTLPRTSRRQNQVARLTPAVNRLPLII